jgi:predicted RNase H-like HicB family nuclease
VVYQAFLRVNSISLSFYTCYNEYKSIFGEYLAEMNIMEKLKFTYYQEDNMWVGWLEDYPDYRTQGKDLEELKENLKDIYDELTSGKIPHVRKSGEIAVG